MHWLRRTTLAIVAGVGFVHHATAQDAGTIRLLGPTGGAVKAMVENLIPEFTKRTGVKVETTFVSAEALTQKAMTEFVAGSPSFDVVMFETSWAGRYSPYLLDLKALQARDAAQFQPDDILPAARNMGIYEGKVVGIPYRVLGRMLHYRKDLFEQAGIQQPPKTFAELLDAAKKLTKDTDGDGKPDVYGLGIIGKQGFGNAYEYGSFLFSSGGSWWDLAKCQVKFDDAVGVRSLEYFAGLLKDKVVPPEVPTWQWDEVISGAQQGRFAMTIMHVPYAVLFDDAKASKTSGKWAWADAPGWDGLAQSAPPVGGWNLGIPTATAGKDKAWEFIKLMTGPEGQLTSALNLNAPTRASSFQDARVQKIWPWAEIALRSLKNGTPMYNNPEEAAAETMLQVKVSEALLGTKEPKVVAKEAADQLRQILKDSGRCK